MQQKGVQPDWNLRGALQSTSDGSYWFRSVKPRHYPIPTDGPVGQMLEKLGRHPNRAAHLHFIVTAPGFEPVVTHIFTPDCPYLPEDAVFGVKHDLIADFTLIDDAKQAQQVGLQAPYWSVEWNFTLAPRRAGGASSDWINGVAANCRSHPDAPLPHHKELMTTQNIELLAAYSRWPATYIPSRTEISPFSLQQAEAVQGRHRGMG